MSKPRILTIDIEMAPATTYSWGIWNVNIGINQIQKPGYMICFAARWYGEDEVIFKSIHHDSKKQMLDTVWELIDEADAVIGYNSQGFDLKHINREFVEAGYLPPTDVKHIDLLKVVRKEFKFISNKLQHISKRIGLEGKLETGGFELWIDCMNGDDDAWSKMREYNIQDILLTEEAYEILLPWINTPTLNVALFSEEVSCPRCGGEEFEALDKNFLTKTASYKQHRCSGCGYIARDRKADPTAIKPSLV